MGGNRRFGSVLVVACGIFYGIGLLRYREGSTIWLVVGVALLVITVAVPRILRPARDLWLRLGGLLHVIISPVLLILFYFTGITPIGLAMKLLRRDPLRLKRKRKTYWVERHPPGPRPQTMPEVF
jgi:Saxitoxin biosynthesis operon protein SxtJ